MQRIGALISESRSSRNITVEKNGIKGELTISTNILSLKGEEEEIFIFRNISIRLYNKDKLIESCLQKLCERA